MNSFEKLQQAIIYLSLPPEINLRIVSGTLLENKHILLHAADEHAIYFFTNKEFEGSRIIELINSSYPSDYLIEIVTINENEVKKFQFHADELKNYHPIAADIFLYFNPWLAYSSLTAFSELIAHLRAPDGCPWDRKQDHLTLRTNLLEETYEVLDAIDNQDIELLKEELGDLLLQILLHAQIAAENGSFNIYEVISKIHAKITYRHPHVFENLLVEDVDHVTRNWEMLKSREREKNHPKAGQGILASVPKNLPALAVAQKYQERAARVGFDWPDIAPVWKKVEEEIRELKVAHTDKSREHELGDLLFAIVNLIRWYGHDAESILRQMNARFLSRFNYIEKNVSSRGKKLTDLSLEELDSIWDMAKQAEAQ